MPATKYICSTYWNYNPITKSQWWLDGGFMRFWRYKEGNREMNNASRPIPPVGTVFSDKKAEVAQQWKEGWDK